MFAGCMSTPAVIVHDEPGAKRLPSNPCTGTQRDLASLRRTLLKRQGSSIVARDADLMINMSMSPRYSATNQASPSSSAGPSRSKSGAFSAAAAAASVFQRLPSAAFGRSRSQPVLEQQQSDEQQQQQQRLPQQQQPKARLRHASSQPQQQQGVDIDDVDIDMMEACAMLAQGHEEWANDDENGNGFWGGEVEDFKADDASAASSLPDLNRHGSTLQWSASRKNLEETLEAAAEASQAQVEPDMKTEEERLGGRLSEFNLMVFESVGDGNCLFRSVSQQLYDTQAYHMALRATAVKHMR